MENVWVIVFSADGFYDEFDPRCMISWGAFRTYEAACEEALKRFTEDKEQYSVVKNPKIMDGLFEFIGNGTLYRYEVVGVALNG